MQIGGREEKQGLTKLLTAPVFGTQHRGCEGHAVGYSDALAAKQAIRMCASPGQNGDFAKAYHVNVQFRTNGWDAYRTANTGNHVSDWAHHLQAASKAFYAHRPVFVQQQCHNVRSFHIF